MENKFILIEEYPGSPKIGTVLEPKVEVGHLNTNNYYWEGSWFNPRKFSKFWREVKTPIFKTEDGIDVFDTTNVTLVCKKYFIFPDVVFPQNCHNIKGWLKLYKIFSTEELAKEYVKMNKPEFSRAQVIELLNNITSPPKGIIINYSIVDNENK